MKNQIARTRKFVSRHRVAIAVGATSAVWLTLMVKRAESWNEFLDEHNLKEAFYFTGKE
jgi:hypothetical protein